MPLSGDPQANRTGFLLSALDKNASTDGIQKEVNHTKSAQVPLTESLILRHLANRHYETKTSYPEHPETDPQYLESEAPEHTSLEVNAPKGCSFSV